MHAHCPVCQMSHALASGVAFLHAWASAKTDNADKDILKAFKDAALGVRVSGQHDSVTRVNALPAGSCMCVCVCACD